MGLECNDWLGESICACCQLLNFSNMYFGITHGDIIQFINSYLQFYSGATDKSILEFHITIFNSERFTLFMFKMGKLINISIIIFFRIFSKILFHEFRIIKVWSLEGWVDQWSVYVRCTEWDEQRYSEDRRCETPCIQRGIFTYN